MIVITLDLESYLISRCDEKADLPWASITPPSPLFQANTPKVVTATYLYDVIDNTGNFHSLVLRSKQWIHSIHNHPRQDLQPRATDIFVRKPPSRV